MHLVLTGGNCDEGITGQQCAMEEKHRAVRSPRADLIAESLQGRRVDDPLVIPARERTLLLQDTMAIHAEVSTKVLVESG